MTIGIYIIHLHADAYSYPSKIINYIGQSTEVEARLGWHRRALRNGFHHNIHLQHAWNAHKESDFRFALIEEVDIDLLTDREQFWIDQFFGRHYNIASPISANYVAKETRDRISRSLKGRVQPQTEIEARRKTIATKVTLKNGMTFPTLTEFAKACKFSSRANVTTALSRGHSFDDIAARRGLFGEDEQRRAHNKPHNRYRY